MRFEDLNWMDVESYLKNDDRLIVVLGACEEHGYLSLLTDIRIPMALADAASARTNVLVAPPLNFGISPYFAKYPGIQEYIERTKVSTRQTQYVQTLLGRRRPVPEINAANFNVRGAAERMAINMPIQGTAADIMKLAMIRVHRRLEQEKLRAKMLLQVHDELVFEVPKEELEALKELVFDEMPAAMDLDVTLKVDAKWGYTWGDME